MTNDSLSVFEDVGYEVNQDGPGVRCIKESDFTGSSFLRDRATSYLKIGAELGLGTDQVDNMDMAEIKLG